MGFLILIWLVFLAVPFEVVVVGVGVVTFTPV